MLQITQQIFEDAIILQCVRQQVKTLVIYWLFERYGLYKQP